MSYADPKSCFYFENHSEIDKTDLEKSWYRKNKIFSALGLNMRSIGNELWKW